IRDGHVTGVQTCALPILAVPKPKAGELLIRIEACAVCRTDLHIVDGELSEPKLPLIIGHQITGIDQASGKRIGVPWLAWTDGTRSEERRVGKERRQWRGA